MADLDFQKLLEPAPFGVVVFELSGSLHFCNDKAKQLLLIDSEEKSKQFNLLEESSFIESADKERLLLAFSGQQIEISALCLNFPEQGEVWVNSVFCPEFDDNGQQFAVTAYFYDISAYHALQHQLLQEMEEEQRLTSHLSEAQRQLQQSEKLATVGQLAAGIAHEINNPIGYVGSNINTLKSYIAKVVPLISTSKVLIEEEIPVENSEIASKLKDLREQLGDDSLEYLLTDLADIVDECAVGISRVKSIVGDMKAVAHSGDDERDWIDIHGAIDVALNIANNEIKYKASVKKEFAELPKLYCSSSQMNQIFLNLFVNAAQAIEARGVITVRTRENSGNVEIDIEDNGSGIEANKLSKIFETFYTSKPAGKGTGLGLPIVKDIITRHGGEINVHSHLGEGTCFTVRLPINQENCDKELVKGVA